MANLELKQIRKRYRLKEVLHGIDLSVREGQLVVIVGPSGSGKSTLLRLIAGLDSVDSGEILLNNNLINNLTPQQRDIAMVFQHYSLYPHMTVMKNLVYGLKHRGYTARKIQTQIQKVVPLLQLERLLTKKTKQLSDPERQRVAIARAMVREPSLYLLDEPFSGLDTKLRSEMRIEIHQLQREAGVSGIYATHDQQDAMALADIMAVMNEGVVEQVGTPLDVYRRPASIFVAGFIGSPAMNFISATLVESGKTLLITPEHPLRVPYSGLEKYDHQEIIIGIRPEALTLARSSEDQQIQLRVEIAEPFGSDTVVYGRILAGLQQRFVAKLPGNIRTHVGEIMTMAIDPAKLHFFDKTTGKRIFGI